MTIAVVADRKDAVYEPDETIVFKVFPTGPRDRLPQHLPYVVWAETGGETSRGLMSGGTSCGEVSVPAREPSFIHFRLEISKGGSECPEAVAAVSPEQIGPSLPVPSDFDDFWTEELELARSLPVESQTSPRRMGDMEILDVAIRMPDRRDAHAWLLRPRGPGPFPAVVRFHGSGVYPVPATNGLDWAERGVMVLSVNPHAIPNDREREFYESLRLGPLADYRTQGRNNRKTVYFREMFLRAARAADYVAGHPDWDGANLIAEGHSQGGGQAIALAGLHGQVSALVASHPTHCDHAGIVADRVAGWPKIVEVHDGVPDPDQLQAARYIDAVNFAARVRCPSLFCVGFMDDLCPPTGVYAAYNAVKGPKTMLNEPRVGHVHTETCKSTTYEWVRSILT